MYRSSSMSPRWRIENIAVSSYMRAERHWQELQRRADWCSFCTECCWTNGYGAAISLSLYPCRKIRWWWCCKHTYLAQSWGICEGMRYLQSIIIVRVSLSLASWNGGSPHTNMYNSTPRLQTSESLGTVRCIKHSYKQSNKINSISTERRHTDCWGVIRISQ